jgi:hypothetical protein
MKSFSLAALALSAFVAAQDTNLPSLTEVLESNSEELSQLSSKPELQCLFHTSSLT